jgi:hypothetical protein
LRRSALLLTGLFACARSATQAPTPGAMSPSASLAAASRALLPPDTRFLRADSIALSFAPSVTGARATGWRCFNCGAEHVSLLLVGTQRVPVRSAADLPTLWQAVGPDSSDAAGTRKRLIELFDATCVLGCSPRLLYTARSLSETESATLYPPDGLQAISPPEDHNGSTNRSTHFYLYTADGVFVVDASISGASLLLRTQRVAATVRS